MIAGIVLFIVGIVATVGVPAFDIGLTDSPDDDSTASRPESTNRAMKTMAI